MIIGKLITRPLQDHDKPGKEIGQFELEIVLEEKFINNSGDPKSFVNKTIGMWLASAILDTEVPQEYWAFIPARKIRRAFNWPEIMPFK